MKTINKRFKFAATNAALALQFSLSALILLSSVTYPATAASVSSTAAPTFSQSAATENTAPTQLETIDTPATTEEHPHYINLLAQVTSPSVNQIEELSRQILLKCVELERYNLNYRQTVAKQGRWKGWRYFLSQFGSNSISESGYITGTAERGRNFQTPTKVARKTVEDGNAITMVGSIVGGTGTGIEFLINAYHEVETHMKGFSPKVAKAKVLSLKSQINSLLAQRAQLIQNLASSDANPQYVAVANAEEGVLKDIRDISLKEFVEFHVQARRLLSFQQSLYIGDIGRQATGACASRFGWRALRYGNRHNNLTSGIFQLISGAITIANPVVSRRIGALNGVYNRHYVQEALSGVPPKPSEALARDIETLRSACAGEVQVYKTLPLMRTSVYAEHGNGVKAQLASSARELRAGYLAAAENIEAGAFIGGLKLSGGVLFSVAGNRYRRSSLKTNVYLGTTNILNTVGSGFAMADNLRIQLHGEFIRGRLAKQGKLPAQIIGSRLATLTKIEKSLATPVSSNNHVSMIFDDPGTLWALSAYDKEAIPDLNLEFALPAYLAKPGADVLSHSTMAPAPVEPMLVP